MIYDDKVYIGVGQDPEHGEGVGNFWCIDADADGDITEKGAVWHRGGNDFHRTISTVAIQDGIVYAADLSGFLYALDAKTGQHYWTHDMLAAVWGSPFVADGKVYLGDEDGDVAVLKAGKTKKVIAELNMGVSVYSTPLAKDGVLYVLGAQSALRPAARRHRQAIDTAPRRGRVARERGSREIYWSNKSATAGRTPQERSVNLASSLAILALALAAAGVRSADVPPQDRWPGWRGDGQGVARGHACRSNGRPRGTCCGSSRCRAAATLRRSSGATASS